MRERTHETTPAEIAAVQAAFVSAAGMYPSPLQAQSVLNCNGGDVQHAIRIFRETLDTFPGETDAEKIYAEVDTDKARGQRAAQAFLAFRAPAKPEIPLANSEGAEYSARLGAALLHSGVTIDQVVAAFASKA